MQRSTKRQLTSVGVAATLSKAGIPATGVNKLTVLSRTGTQYQREDGTRIRIFNVLAFKSVEDQKAAVEHWKDGTTLEKSGDLEGAQVHYTSAYNLLMSFSVLEDNAPAFENGYEINCRIDMVPASAATQAAGTKTVLGIQSPRPVTISANITNIGTNLFVMPEDPATTPETAAQKKARLKAGAKTTAL